MLYFVIAINCDWKNITIGKYSSFLLTQCTSMATRCTWRMYSREHTCRKRGSTSLQLQHLFRSGISLGFFPAELEERCAGSQDKDELNKNEYFFLLQIFQEWPLDVYVCKAALFCLPQSVRRRSEGCGRNPCYETTSEEPKPNLDAVWGLTALLCQTFWISALKRLHCLLSPFSRKDLDYECSRRKDTRLRPKNRMFTFQGREGIQKWVVEGIRSRE